MIQKVSQVTFAPSFSKNNKVKKEGNPIKDSRKNAYVDSFVKHTKESAPMLLGLTALWSALDFGAGKGSMSKIMLNNLAFFFTPVLIVSSSIMAGIENKKTSKSSNP